MRKGLVALADFVFGPGHPFPAGLSVSVYDDKGQNPSGSPSGAAVASGTVTAGGVLALTGLGIGKRYWVVGIVGGAYLWVRVYTQRNPEPPLEQEIVRGKDLAVFGSTGQMLEVAGPLTEAAVDALLLPGGQLSETDGVGPDGKPFYVNVWGKTSA